MLKKSALLTALALVCALQAARAPYLAERGIESYRGGRHQQARIYFSQAMQAAVLQAREDWVVKAALNLVDLELDAHNWSKVRQLLGNIPGISHPELQTAVLWKKAQYYFCIGNNDSASVLIQQAVKSCSNDYRFCHSLLLDSYRIQLENQLMNPDGVQSLKDLVSHFKHKLPEAQKAEAAGIQALLAMKVQDYQAASGFWREAVDYHRRKGQLPKMAKCLNYLALSVFMNGDREKAREINSRCIKVYHRLDLTLPGLGAMALNLFLYADQAEVKKTKSHLELIGKDQPGFDLKAVVRDYQKFANLILPPALSYPAH